jgi:hypothetical protein
MPLRQPSRQPKEVSLQVSGLKTDRGPCGAQDSGGHHRLCVGHATIAGGRFRYPWGVLITHDLPRPSRRGFSSEW